MNRERYTIDSVVNNRFYQMPKFLFEGEFKKSLSSDSRILYSLLKDRHELSLQNHWINKNNEVYLIYTREDMSDMLGCSQPTIRKAVSQLINIGLIEEERPGFNRANRIYLTTVMPDITGLKDSFSPDCKNISLRSVNNFQSRAKDSFSQECKKLSPNDTNIINTNISNTEDQSINQDIQEIDVNDVDIINNLLDKKTEEINQIEKYKTLISQNIQRDILKERYPRDPDGSSIVDEIYSIMVDVVTSTKDYVRVNGESRPANIVKSVFLKIDQFHVEYVIESMNSNTTKANNIRAYLITALYNSIGTINLFYQNKAQHTL